MEWVLELEAESHQELAQEKAQELLTLLAQVMKIRLEWELGLHRELGWELWKEWSMNRNHLLFSPIGHW